MIDDHLIDSLRRYFNAEYAELKKEWLSGKYSKLSECPSFRVTATYRHALNVLIKSEYVDETELRELLQEELELDKWRNR